MLAASSIGCFSTATPIIGSSPATVSQFLPLQVSANGLKPLMHSQSFWPIPRTDPWSTAAVAILSESLQPPAQQANKPRWRKKSFLSFTPSGAMTCSPWAVSLTLRPTAESSSYPCTMSDLHQERLPRPRDLTVFNPQPGLF